MTEETDDLDMSKEFNEARQFHANFYQNFLSDEQITQSRLIVRGFVLKVLSFIA